MKREDPIFHLRRTLLATLLLLLFGAFPEAFPGTPEEESGAEPGAPIIPLDPFPGEESDDSSGAGILPAGPQPKREGGSRFKIEPGEFKFTGRYYFRRLIHPTRRDKFIGAGVLLSSLALAVDKRDLQADMAERHTPTKREGAIKAVQKLGGGGIVPAMALLFYTGGAAAGNSRAKQTGFMLGESLLFTDLVTAVGRWALAEDRPKYGGKLHAFSGYGGGVSGHSATAASISGVLSRMVLQVDADDGRAKRAFKKIGKGFVYGTPVLVAFGRIHTQQHYAYNTLLGLSIGYWSGHVVADAHEIYSEDSRSRWKPAAVGPITTEAGERGFGARWDF